jgi:tetratricopeptide (TPR) repeat protein
MIVESLPRQTVFVLALLAFSAQASAQGLGAGANTSAELQVRVLYDDDRPVSNMVNVQFLSSQGIPVGESFTDDTGRVTFHGVRPGSYILRARGPMVEETLGSSFVITPRESYHNESLYVRRKTSPSSVDSSAGRPTVHVNDLNVPRNAEKKYEKGMEALRKGSLEKARGLFEEAVAQHPQYPSAYNALGVAYMQLGRPAEGRAAFEKAITLDERFALPYLNLGKIAMSENHPEEAVAQLTKCVANDPLNPEALSRLAYNELLVGNLDKAIADAHKVHSLPHSGYEASHLIAARALRKKQMPSEAIAEYKLFLSEAPSSPTAQKARQELSEIEKQTP